MRRFTLTLATSIAALALLPAGALAGAHSRHHQRRRHHVHHSIVRHERFGAVTNSTSAGGSNSGTTGTPSPAENAGTVQSFNADVLTLALANGSTVSGLVDNGTEIECEMADINEINDMRADGHGDRGDDNGNEHQNCRAADLVVGASVRSAELRISSAGATWDKVELIG